MATEQERRIAAVVGSLVADAAGMYLLILFIFFFLFILFYFFILILNLTVLL